MTTILESTGLGDPAFSAQFLVSSSMRSVVRKVKETGEYKALLTRLLDPEAHEQLFTELKDELQKKRMPGYANPLDIAVMACRFAVYSRQQYHKRWDDLVDEHWDELHYGRLSVYPQEL